MISESCGNGWLFLWANRVLSLISIIGAAAAVATLYFIKRQADTANKTLVAQFRPKVIIRRMKLNPATSALYDGLADRAWKIELQIANTGGTVAHVLKCIVSLHLKDDYPTGQSPETWNKSYAPFSLIPGERRTLDLVFSSDAFRAALHVMEHIVRKGEKQYTWPLCTGTITYADDNGFTRETEFQRSWNVKTLRFDASTDPEYEYAD